MRKVVVKPILRFVCNALGSAEGIKGVEILNICTIIIVAQPKTSRCIQVLNSDHFDFLFVMHNQITLILLILNAHFLCGPVFDSSYVVSNYCKYHYCLGLICWQVFRILIILDSSTFQ